MSFPGSNSPTAKAPDSEPKGVGRRSNLSMSVVAMVVLSRGESLALDTNCAQLYERAFAAIDDEVLGL